MDIKKQSALADIEALDMIKDSICSECDSYLDFSELKDNMCAKCGDELNRCTINYDEFNEEEFEEKFINLFNEFYYVKPSKPFFDYKEGDEYGDMFENALNNIKWLIQKSYKRNK